MKTMSFWQWFLFVCMLFEIICAFVFPKEIKHEIKITIFLAAAVVCGHIDKRIIDYFNKKQDE